MTAVLVAPPPAKARAKRPPLSLLIPAVLAGAVALLPLIYLGIRAFENGAGAVVDEIWRDRTFWLVVRSLALAASVTAVTVLLGVSLAWLTTRSSVRGRRIWMVVLALPLAVPSYVAAYVWVAAWPTVPPYVGSVLVLALCTYPYVMLPVAAVLARTDPALEEVSRSLGNGPMRTFCTVTLRQVRPAAAAGGLLVALYALSDFGAVALLRYDVFTRVIYTSYTSSIDRTAAAILGLLLVLITVIVVGGESRSRGRAGTARLGSGAARGHRVVQIGRFAPLAYGWMVGVVVAGIGFPLASLAFWLVRGSSAGFDGAELGRAAIAMVVVSALGAIVAIVLAVPVGVLAARFPGRVSRGLEQAAYAGHALPGIVVALALVFLGVRYAYGLYQEIPLLVVAYAVLFLPLAVGAVRASVAQSPPVLDDVARSLGRSPLGVLRDVTMPLAGPGVAAGAVLVFLTCMKELPATLLLRPTGMNTLATELWTYTNIQAYGAAAPYAALLVLIAAVPTLLLARGSALGVDVRAGR